MLGGGTRRPAGHAARGARSSIDGADASDDKRAKNMSTDPATFALPRVPSAPAPLAVCLRIRAPGIPERSVPIGSGVVVLGAGADADVVLEDRAVSRRHLRVTVVAEGVHVEDLDSRNGSFYSEHRFTGMTLALGASVRLGETEVRFEADGVALESSVTAPRMAARDSYGELFGVSPPMRRLFALLERLEGSLVPVLVEGESGTGKELVARALHEHSQVRNGPLVVVNCGSLDRALVRSELFGYRRGAFTGAVGESLGAIGEADGGTLFLDEVGELPLDVQPVLLRVLETGSYTRVGESKERPVRLRVVSATNRSLEEEVEAGRFRSDLFFRLMVVLLRLPPLRERREDLGPLVGHLTKKLGLEPLPDAAFERLRERSYPGNVRELRNLLASYGAVGVLPEGRGAPRGALEAALEERVDFERPYSDFKDELVELATRLYLARLLEKTGGNLSEASRVSGLQRGYLRSLVDRFGLR